MKKLIYLCFFVVSINDSSAQTFNPQLSTMLQDTFATYLGMIPNIKGMSASVYIPGQGLWQGAGGLSHAGVPITTDMEFGIASNTKLFVSTAMLMLAENNIIHLDDSLHEWLPAYPNVNSNITIRQLLNHTSGISDPIFVAPWMDTIMANPTRVFTPNEVLSWLGPPTFTAGSSYGYSNVNYILAGMIAESATGFHISKIIRDSILIPLNLDSTFYDIEEQETGIIAHRWWNTVDYNDTSRIGLNTAGGAAGSVFSTSSEMAHWYNALFNGQLINEFSMNELTTFIPTSATQSYGLGLLSETTQGYTYWGHGGDTWGYKSKMIYDPCNGTVVCGLANSFPAGMSAIAFLLYRVVINHITGCSETILGIDTLCAGTDSIVYTVPPIANATSYLWTLPSGAIGLSNTNTITVNYTNVSVSGYIQVSGLNMYGAGGTSKLWITVNPIPATPIIVQSSDTLFSNAISGNQWYNSNGLISGANNQYYVATVSDSYYSIVTDLGCSSAASASIDVIVTSIQDEAEYTTLQIYPNPFSDELFIKTAYPNQILKVEIINVLGQVIFQNKITGNAILNTHHFIPGLYMIKIDNGKSLSFEKLIKN